MSKTAIKTLNFLSIGDRGVGKTVFLLASYAALQLKPTNAKKQRILFDCRDTQDRNNIESLLKRIAQTGQYPPPTLQMTDFTFDVKDHSRRGEQSLCQLHWWDVPGESCQSSDPDFQAVLLKSHGCCLFLDAYELVHNPQYLSHLATVIKRAEAIASLAHRHQLHYSIALVLTKCDRIDSGASNLMKLEEQLHPLTKSLNAFNANFRSFYSAAPIAAFQDPTLLQAQGVSAPLLWLMTETRSEFQQTLEQGLEGALSNSAVLNSTIPLSKSLSGKRSLRPRLLIGSGILVAIAGVFVGLRFLGPMFGPPLSSDPDIRKYQVLLRRDPNNATVLRQLATEYGKSKQYSQAIPLLEQLAQQQPDDYDLLIELAGLYLVTDQPQKEEEIYDQILRQDTNNILALTGKAEVHLRKGDIEKAKLLFSQAEKSAPTAELKSTVSKIAADRLQDATGGAEK